MHHIRLGALFAGLAVAAGAFGAHGLEGIVTPDRLDIFKTAAQYQMYHALALLIIGLIHARSTLVTWSGHCFTGGILVFSGSLYLLVLTNTSWLGAITPIGGLLFIAGWILLFVYSFQRANTDHTRSSSSKESDILG